MAAAQSAVLARGAEDLFAFASLVVWQLLFATLWSSAYVAVVGGELIAIIEGHDRNDWLTQLTRVWNQTLIETVRVWARTTRWALALGAPAAFVYTRLSWTPLIAALDPAYDRGEIDALDRSWALSKGRVFLSLLVVLVSVTTPELASMIARGSDDRLLDNPLGVIGGTLIGAVASLALFGWALAIYRRLSTEAEPPPSRVTPSA